MKRRPVIAKIRYATSAPDFDTTVAEMMLHVSEPIVALLENSAPTLCWCPFQSRDASGKASFQKFAKATRGGVCFRVATHDELSSAAQLIAFKRGASNEIVR